MVNINILCPSGTPFFSNWDKIRYPKSEYNICINSDADIVWDCVVIYQNISNTKHFRCYRGKVIYVSGEPPLMFPCPHSFTQQFDEVVVTNPKIEHINKQLHHGYLSWQIGLDHVKKEYRYDYQMLKDLVPSKTKLISVITSNQRMMPGHNQRMKIMEKLMRDYSGIIDFYGKGINFVDCKADALFPYKFHICMENSSLPHYWTEKFADPILAQSVPIYAGCTNISDYFGDRGYFKFDIANYNSLKIVIDKILDNPDYIYESMKKDLIELRRILMETENMIVFCVNKAKNSEAGLVKEYTIYPLEETEGYDIELKKLRLKRFLYRICHF